MKIICVSGKKGVGKSTLGLIMAHKYGFAQVSFAGPLKSMLCQMFNLKRTVFEKPEFKEKDVVNGWTPRTLMLEFGEKFKSVQPDFWVQKVITDLNYQHDLFRLDKFIITDCRFEVEAKAMKDKGAYLVRLNREAALNPYKTNVHKKDKTECDLDSYTGWDMVVASKANRTPKDLEAVADMLAAKVGA